MTLPQQVQGSLGDEILAFILVTQQCGEGLQTLDCFTWNIEPSLRLLFSHHAALRREWTNMAARAAGVTPRIRRAAPRVAGLAAARRSTISLDSPGIEP